MREYHFCNSSGSSVTGAPHPRVLRVGVLVWNSDVQLLPAVAVARDSASKKLVRQGTARGSPKFVSVSTSGPLVTFPFSVHCGQSVVNSLRFVYRIGTKPMPDQPPSERFKSEMPAIPGVAGPGARRPGGNPAAKLVIGLLAVLLVVFLGARWALRPKHADPPKADQQPQIEVPSPAPDPSTLLPHATESNPGIADTTEMAKPWSSKEFYIRNGLTGENIPALLVRLPAGSPTQANGYWAFAQKSPFGNCQLEYITDLAKLKSEYGFSAKHPMVGNPCSRTVFDPLRMATLPGNFLVRGAIAQGSDLRPPLAVELKIRGKDILAIRTE